MRKLGWALAASLSVMGPQVGAQTFTGNQLHEACNGGLPDLQFFCSGFVMGVIEGYGLGAALPVMAIGEATAEEAAAFASSFLGYCLPSDVTNGQNIDVVKLYLVNNPQLRHETARMNIMLALQEAFPCF